MCNSTRLHVASCDGVSILQHSPRCRAAGQKLSRTPDHGDLDHAPLGDLTQTLSPWPLLSANFLTAQSAPHDTRYSFGTQFQLVSHVSGCEASCPQAIECNLRLWTARRFVVCCCTATGLRLCPRWARPPKGCLRTRVVSTATTPTLSKYRNYHEPRDLQRWLSGVHCVISSHIVQ